LFVSEGTSSSKLTSVKSNDYLSFAYQQLVEHEGSLVIFGQSLDPTYDQHLVNAIRGRRWRRLAISIYRGSKTDAEITNEKTVWFVRFDGLGFSIDFFDSTTHPLGNPAFYVP
jgi:glycogen synthase